MKTRNSIFLALLPLLTVSFVSNVAPYIYIPSLPDIASDFNLTESQAGNLLSVYSLILSLTMLIVGMVGDSWNKRRLLVGASFITFIGAVLSAITGHFSVLLLGWALQAAGAATIVIVGQTWIGQSSKENNITRLFSYLTIVLSFAPLIAPILGGIINDLFVWRYNFYVMAILSFLALLFINKTTPPPPIHAKRSISAKEIINDYSRILFKSPFIGLISTSLACFLFQGALMAYSSFLVIDQLQVPSSLYGLISIPTVAGIIAGQLLVNIMEKKRGIVPVYKLNSAIVLIALGASLGYYFITGVHSIVELSVVLFVFNIGFGGHTLLALRNVMLKFSSQRSYSSALINFSNHFMGYIASLFVQFLFILVDSPMLVHNIISITAIILIFLSFPYFKYSYSKE